RYEEFVGVVGKSDLRGTLQYQFREPRPLLSGEVASDLLRLRDLGPLIGLDTSDAEGNKNDGKAQKDKAGAESEEGRGGEEGKDGGEEARDGEAKEQPRKQPPGKALPVARIGSETWDLMDADVRFEGKRIVRDEDLPFDDISAQIRLQDRVLSFEPLNFGVAGGKLVNTLKIDGRGETLKAEMSTEIRGLQLKQLFPGAESMNASFGQLHGDARLSGTGDSIAGLLGSSNGELSVALSRGTISRFLIEAAGLNVANVVFVKLFGDEQVMLE